MTKKKLLMKAHERAKKVQNNHYTKPDYKEYDNKKAVLNHEKRVDKKRRLAAKTKELNKDAQVDNEQMEKENLLIYTAAANDMFNK